MADPLESLAELADAVERGGDDGSLDSERAIQLRAVEPLLEILGWNVRGPEVVPETELAGLTVEYLLQIDTKPAVAVRTMPPSTQLTNEALPRLESLLSDGNVHRGILTDGRTIHLLIADEDDVHGRSISFTALADHADALGQFHRSILEETVALSRSDRREAAGRLAENRDALVDAVTAEIVSVTGTGVEDEAAEETIHMIDGLLERLDPGEVDQNESVASEPGLNADDAPRIDDPDDNDDAVNATGTSAPGENDEESLEATFDQSGTPDGSESNDEPDELDEPASDREYVVRFFGGASSVGAVGTNSPGGTAVGTVRYLLENHDLEANITFPWQPANADAILAKTAESPDWTVLENADGTAVAVRPIDEPSVAKGVVEELADATGLRVMFQGDW